MGHLKRYKMPTNWPLSVKSNTWVIKPIPGPHPTNICLPLQIILKDILEYAHTAKEVKKILSQGKILVDKKPRKEPGFPVGMMDVIEIPETKQQFRVMPTTKGLGLEKISQEEANFKICKINGKKTVKKGLIQLSFHDGRNVLVKGKNDYKCGDSVLIKLPNQEVMKHYKLQTGKDGLVINGKNIGVKGKIKNIKKRKNMLEKSIITIESGKDSVETLYDYVMVYEPKLEKEKTITKKSVTKERKGNGKNRK